MRKNEGNGMLIVSYVKWRTKRNGRFEIVRTYSRAFRNDIEAKRQYRAILDSLSDRGYRLTDITSECYSDCEGVRGYVRHDKEAEYSSDFVVLYLTRNEPLYD